MELLSEYTPDPIFTRFFFEKEPITFLHCIFTLTWYKKIYYYTTMVRFNAD